MTRLLHRSGLQVENLLELQPPGAAPSHPLATIEWARQKKSGKHASPCNSGPVRFWAYDADSGP